MPLARALSRRGRRVQVLLSVWDCPQEGGMHALVDGATLRAPHPGRGYRGLFPQLTRLLRREVAAFSPDVLVVSKGLGYAGWVMRWWLSRGGLAVLDMDDDERAWRQRRGQNALLDWCLSRQERQLIRRASGVLAASTALARTAQYLAPTQKVLLLPNGLEPAPERAPVEQNPPQVLLLSRGHDVDVQALRRIWPAILEQAPEASLTLLGGWAQAPKLPRTIHRGWLEPEAYVRTLRRSAIALFLPPDTALVRAKSPARVLDCLAQGVPVVTLDVGEYGRLVRVAGGEPAANEQALLAQAITLLKDAKARGRWSKRASRHAPALSWDHRAAGLDAWLQSAI